jgi:hypothetical protein
LENFGTFAPTSQMSTHIKGLQHNVGKRKLRCHILTGNGIIEESVAACAQKQRQQKTSKDNRKQTKKITSWG